MQPPPLHGINGRLRQHITKVGAHHANRISSPISKKAVTDDDFVKGLLESGRLTKEQLQRAVDGYNHIPSNFVWLQKVEDSVLDRADNVFLAKYGRDATEDSDFRLNGDYYKICKNLRPNWHYYDSDLEKLLWDYKSTAHVVADIGATIVEGIEYRKCPEGSLLIFLPLSAFFLLVAGPVGVLMIIAGIEHGQWVGIVFGPVALITFIVPLFQSRPRSARKEVKIRKCSQCGRKISQLGSPSSCSGCGVRFQGK